MKVATDKLITLKVIVTPETACDVDKLLTEQGWTTAEGLRLLLGVGMAAARVQAAQTEGEDALHCMEERLKDVEGSLAVLRFNMYEMQKANQAWELSTGAIRNQNLGYSALIRRQKDEIEALKSRLAEAQAEVTHVKTLVGEIPPAPQTVSPKTSRLNWWQKLWRRQS